MLQIVRDAFPNFALPIPCNSNAQVQVINGSNERLKRHKKPRLWDSEVIMIRSDLDIQLSARP